jgi:hypothetical protein
VCAPAQLGEVTGRTRPEQVLNLWGGHRDAARRQPWQRDTITNLWSITKTVTTLAALLLVDAGELDVDAPVARYWPEFAANGKQDVAVRHVLSHTSGVAGLDHPAELADLYDVRSAAARMAAQPPWWKPGSASGYHVLNCHRAGPDFDPSVLDHDTVAYRAFTGPSFSATAANTPAWRAADLGAANGHGYALSVAGILRGSACCTSVGAPAGVPRPYLR